MPYHADSGIEGARGQQARVFLESPFGWSNRPTTLQRCDDPAPPAAQRPSGEISEPQSVDDAEPFPRRVLVCAPGWTHNPLPARDPVPPRQVRREILQRSDLDPDLDPVLLGDYWVNHGDGPRMFAPYYNRLAKMWPTSRQQEFLTKNGPFSEDFAAMFPPEERQQIMQDASRPNSADIARLFNMNVDALTALVHYRATGLGEQNQQHPAGPVAQQLAMQHPPRALPAADHRAGGRTHLLSSSPPASCIDPRVHLTTEEVLTYFPRILQLQDGALNVLVGDTRWCSASAVAGFMEAARGITSEDRGLAGDARMQGLRSSVTAYLLRAVRAQCGDATKTLPQWVIDERNRCRRPALPWDAQGVDMRLVDIGKHVKRWPKGQGAAVFTAVLRKAMLRREIRGYCNWKVSEVFELAGNLPQ